MKGFEAFPYLVCDVSFRRSVFEKIDKYTQTDTDTTSFTVPVGLHYSRVSTTETVANKYTGKKEVVFWMQGSYFLLIQYNFADIHDTISAVLSDEIFIQSQ